MKYKLYKNSRQDLQNIEKTILQNRGIVEWNTYLNLTDEVLIPYDNLDNIGKAVECFTKHFENNNKISILVDSDPDGYCSAAMMYSYIKELDLYHPVDYIMHKQAKSHGLSEFENVVEMLGDTKLLIIPDAGTNDFKECQAIKDNGIDIIILDHHQKEFDNSSAIIVNNQMSDNYSNKNLCGAGIVYKFLQALDEHYWNEKANDYLDLVALANISDVMDIRSFETRHLINKGLSNINNKFFKAIIKAQDYSINGNITIHNIQWYITPVLNAMIRVGSYEDKELLFRAFIEDDEEFTYKKRATKTTPSEIIIEDIYDRAARLCKNTKARQDKMKDKSFDEICSEITEDSSKVIMLDVTNMLDNGLTGVVAIKVAEKYNKPCILLQKRGNDYGGSMKNFNHSPIENFKDIINSCSAFDNCLGHPNAAGVNLPVKNKNLAIQQLNARLKNVEYDTTYLVDFILDICDVDFAIINNMTKLNNIIGQGIDEPKIAVKNICLNKSQFSIYGKNNNVISFILNNVKYVMFKCDNNNPLMNWLNNCWDDTETVLFEIVGSPSVNEYNGLKEIQIVIDDINILGIIAVNDNEEDEIDW